jgi:transcriptional regulator with XRE-family HTH domain
MSVHDDVTGDRDGRANSLNEADAPSSSAGEGSMAERLDFLIRTVRPAGRGEYTYEELSAEIGQRVGVPISGSYIWQLRTGKKNNPTKRHLEALAAFFGVPPAYFFDDGEAKRIDSELKLLTAMRDSGVRSVALRSAGLSQASLDVISAMIEQTRRLEGLEDEETGSA